MFREPLTKGTGVISGTVTNKTTGKPIARPRPWNWASLTRRASSSSADCEDGRRRLLPVRPAADRHHAARTRCATSIPTNVPYSSEFVSFEPGKTEANLPVSVYETTDDAAGIRAERVHYIVEFDAGRALIAELIVLSLDGDKAYVGDGNHVLRFPLPAGAQDLAVNDGELGERFIQIENGFVDRLPLPPGQNTRQILFRYSLPYDGTSLDFVALAALPGRQRQRAGLRHRREGHQRGPGRRRRAARRRTATTSTSRARTCRRTSRCASA